MEESTEGKDREEKGKGRMSFHFSFRSFQLWNDFVCQEGKENEFSNSFAFHFSMLHLNKDTLSMKIPPSKQSLRIPNKINNIHRNFTFM